MSEVGIEELDNVTREMSDDLKNYLARRSQQALACYYKKRVLKPKYECKFVNKNGVKCEHTSYNEYCSRHLRFAVMKGLAPVPAPK